MAEIDEGQALPAMDWERSDATSNDLSGNDASVWPTPAAIDAEMAVILERILQLIENQETRLRQLEEEAVLRLQCHPVFRNWRLAPCVFRIHRRFVLHRLCNTLGAQLQLNEITK